MPRSAQDLTYAQQLDYWDVKSNHGIQHWIVAKKVMRYLQGTKDYWLTHKHVNY